MECRCKCEMQRMDKNIDGRCVKVCPTLITPSGILWESSHCMHGTMHVYGKQKVEKRCLPIEKRCSFFKIRHTAFRSILVVCKKHCLSSEKRCFATQTLYCFSFWKNNVCWSRYFSCILTNSALGFAGTHCPIFILDYGDILFFNASIELLNTLERLQKNVLQYIS